MKITIQLSLSIILLSFYTTTSLFSSCLAAEAPDPVLDITGKELRKGIDYHILPVVRGRGGGLTLASINKTCPLDVVQDQIEVENGLPLTFTPVNAKNSIIRVSTDLNIKFSAGSICVQSTLWKLDNYDESTQKYFVTTGGVEGNPGPETISNWFKIEKYERDYKIVFCPTVCDYCKVICKDVGIFIQGGYRRLALTTAADDVPFRVMFKKA
ncbi:Kunitz family trypsin and protease inhibitor protein [Abeliophyllum distichum]|uniref:Kunitz family trypsin and protease inhibitor protein n=1 Tax=Abeliophyllum distichum TaxID=126358 RepID=A0ABD1VQP1_9LAMI